MPIVMMVVVIMMTMIVMAMTVRMGLGGGAEIRAALRIEVRAAAIVGQEVARDAFPLHTGEDIVDRNRAIVGA